jgi:peptidoglycan/LPS O-acetylase OafA/YrhL
VTTLTAPADAPPAAALPYEPGLDGVRGLALLAIIVYHSGLDWAPGAFLSVSTFFTLSGFLITALLLAEQHRGGRISLSRFWSRRLRRLLPASLVCIAGITLAAVVFADSTQLSRLRGDALAALAYVANWRFIAAGDSYAAGFESPSPFTHFWTLAIEEQFYIALPVVVVGVLLVARGSRRALTAVLGLLTVASLGWSIHLEGLGASTDRLYFGTDVRCAELLVGALLAVWWMRRDEPLTGTPRRVVRLAAPVALAVMLASWMVADLQERAFYRGGLLAYSGLTLLVILGCLAGDGPVTRLTRFAPLVWVGTVSYGAYLLHYPALLWFGQRSTWPALVRLAIVLPLVLGVSHLSVRYFEGPLRRGELLRRPRAAGAAALGGVALTVSVVLGVTTVVEPAEAVDLDAAAQWQRFVEQTEAQQRSDAPRFGFFGDSTALMTSRGVSSLSLDDPERLVSTKGWTTLGCGVFDGGDRVVRGSQLPLDAECVGWEERWAAASAEQPSDLAVVQLGPWEVVDQQLEPGGPILGIGDPRFDRELSERLQRAVGVLSVDNRRVVFLAPPDIDVGRVDGRSLPRPHAESDPARMARFRELLDELARQDPRVAVVPVEDWYRVTEAEDRRLRPDGVHFTDPTSLEVAPELSELLLELHRELNGSERTVVEQR